MNRKDIDELLERYRNNQCTAEEKKTLEEWFDSQAASGDWQWSSEEKTASELAIKGKIDRKLFSSRNTWGTILKIAAILTIVLGSLLFAKERIQNLIDPVAFIEKKVADDKRVQLVLADGSKVWLNAGAKFRYPNRFSKDKRQVFLLEGEAYFEVVRDTEKPFIVTSDEISTKVLGTAFNVKSYSYLRSIQVAVTRGKVSVSNNAGEAVLLLPDQQANFDKTTKHIIRHEVDSRTALAWQKGGQAFNNDSMSDVCAVLAKKYGVTFGKVLDEL
ncbi:MAG: DUF4974 domain-containing protein, partial [Chitinophagaceae bacterium]